MLENFFCQICHDLVVLPLVLGGEIVQRRWTSLPLREEGVVVLLTGLGRRRLVRHDVVRRYPTGRARNVLPQEIDGQRSDSQHIDEPGDCTVATLISPRAARTGGGGSGRATWLDLQPGRGE